MLSSSFLQELSAKAAQALPAAKATHAEIEAKLFDVLQASFSKLNIVTREEFDAQIAVLNRAEATIADLEQKLASLQEQNIESSNQ